MKRSTLAKQLRECQRDLGTAPRIVIDSLSDDLIIESYVTCSDCAARLVDDGELRRMIAEATDYEDFLSLLNEHTAEHVA